jgi:hypothetical protein
VKSLILVTPNGIEDQFLPIASVHTTGKMSVVVQPDYCLCEPSFV